MLVWPRARMVCRFTCVNQQCSPVNEISLQQIQLKKCLDRRNFGVQCSARRLISTWWHDKFWTYLIHLLTNPICENCPNLEKMRETKASMYTILSIWIICDGPNPTKAVTSERLLHLAWREWWSRSAKIQFADVNLIRLTAHPPVGYFWMASTLDLVSIKERSLSGFRVSAVTRCSV